jgi:hypothetical protein
MAVHDTIKRSASTELRERWKWRCGCSIALTEPAKQPRQSRVSSTSPAALWVEEGIVDVRIKPFYFLRNLSARSANEKLAASGGEFPSPVP